MLANEVWGQGFPAPVFVGEFEVLTQTLIQEKHLRVQLKAINSNGSSHPKAFNGIWFSRKCNPTKPSQIGLSSRYRPLSGGCQSSITHRSSR